MPFIRFLASVCCILLAASIFLDSKIMSPYFYYTKKGLVYIAIIVLSSYQPAFYFKYTKANTYFFYNIHSVSINKYTFTIP